MATTNNYLRAIQVEDLFAVMLDNGGWSVADGPGSALCKPDEIELAGWHLPITFKTLEQAAGAILSAPHTMFDITPDSTWTQHCIDQGATPQV